MESDNFCLRWNDFETNISTAFKEIREDKDFFDVTLACDDDQISAHKVILAACSPFFKSILKRNRHEHPLLYLKGVKYTDLVAVLNFMYHGEVNVAQEELNTFLSIAEELKIKGLTQNSSNENSNIQTNSFNKKQEIPYNLKAGPAPKKTKTFAAPQAVGPATTMNKLTDKKISYSYDDDDIQEVLPMKTEPVETLSSSVPVLTTANQHKAGTANQNTALVENSDNSAIYGEDFGEFVDYNAGGEGYEQSVMQDTGDANKDLNSMLDSMISRYENEGPAKFMCETCGKTMARKIDMRRHVEIHLDMSHPCAVCDKVCKTRSSLAAHTSTYHKHQVNSPWSMQ